MPLSDGSMLAFLNRQQCARAWGWIDHRK